MLCSHAYLHLGMYECAKGKNLDESLQKAIMYGKNAIKVNLNNDGAFINISNSYSISALFRMQRGDNPTTAIAEAQKAVDRSLQIGPQYFAWYTDKNNMEWLSSPWEIN